MRSDGNCLYNVPEAAKVLKISRTGVYELMRKGALRGKKLGGRTMITAQDIDAFIASLPDAEFSEAKAG